MKAYVLEAEAPAASTAVMKYGELGPGAVTHRRAAGQIPGTTLYGAYLAMAPPPALSLKALGAFCTRCHFYPALPSAEGSLTYAGVFACEKAKCIYVDYVALAAYEAPRRGDTPPPALQVGIYVDRRRRTAKYGALYSYQLDRARRYVFASEVDMSKKELRLGYKKTYGWGRFKVGEGAPAYPVPSRRHLLLAPVPLEALEKAGVKIQAAIVKYAQPFYVYIMYTNKFYRVGEGLTAAPGTIVEVDAPVTAPALWKRIADAVESLPVEAPGGRKVPEEVKNCVLKKAASTAAAPVAYVVR